jgi:hypothetical protein
MVNGGLKTPVTCKRLEMQGFSARDRDQKTAKPRGIPGLPGPGFRLCDGFKIPARELEHADSPG